MIKTTEQYLNYLAEKFYNEENYTDEEMNNYYCYDNKTQKFVTCFNKSGDCFREEFKTLKAVELYFYSNLDTNEIFELDEQLHQLNQIKNILGIS